MQITSSSQTPAPPRRDESSAPLSLDIRVGTRPRRSYRRPLRALWLCLAAGAILGAAWQLTPWVLGAWSAGAWSQSGIALFALRTTRHPTGRIILWRPKLPDYPAAAQPAEPSAAPFTWAKGWPRICITAVLISSDGIYARVNGRMVTVGDTVDGVRVEEIGLAGVTVAWQGQLRTFQPRQL